MHLRYKLLFGYALLVFNDKRIIPLGLRQPRWNQEIVERNRKLYIYIYSSMKTSWLQQTKHIAHTCAPSASYQHQTIYYQHHTMYRPTAMNHQPYPEQVNVYATVQGRVQSVN
jgi:hypothetical protein